MMQVTHEHALVLRVKEKQHEIFCDVCRRMIVGSAYECEQRKCQFSIHRSCSKFPREIEHPFHTQHPLTFLDDDSEKLECSACGKTGWGFIYRCSDSECQFNLDFVCAALRTTTTKDYQSNQLLTHPHPLIICDKNQKYSPVLCSACDLPMQDLIYVCFECKCLLHESCTQNFPEEIEHPFHPQHPLVLLPRAPYPNRRFGCNACRRGSRGFTYNCSQCQFDLDVHCATLMPIADQEHLSHPHPFFHCNSETDFKFHCNACNLPFEDDSINVCLRCQSLLHNSCVELPEKIQHPFHPLHPLTLRKTSKRIPCRACRNFTSGFAYGCFSCRFQVHTTCGWPIPPFINSECHPQHPLAFFNIEAQRLFCDSCQKQCTSTTGFFTCVECNFNLHVHCFPKLPPTIKHESHLHPLNLITNSPIKDHPDEEFHCSVCEEKRDISHPTYYYCAECHYIAHVHCVVSEVVHLLEEEWSLACKLGDTKLDTPTNVLKENTTDEMVRDISGSSLIELDDAEIEELPTEVETETEGFRTEVEVEEAKLETLKTELKAQEAKVMMLKTKLKAL
uniref:Phorbol-ester/DAG-type domain-containing protein n=1 Tax=Davidia involucrata TaxID=16924 RepID=A0A5B7A6T8_DAVIN